MIGNIKKQSLMLHLYTWDSESLDALMRSSLKSVLNIFWDATLPYEVGMLQFILSISFRDCQRNFVTASILSMRDQMTHDASPFDKNTCAVSLKMWRVGAKKSRNLTLERTPSAE